MSSCSKVADGIKGSIFVALGPSRKAAAVKFRANPCPKSKQPFMVELSSCIFESVQPSFRQGLVHALRMPSQAATTVAEWSEAFFGGG